MNNNRTWEALSMKDRASFIKLAIQNGYRDVSSIRDLYNSSNKYDDGGAKSERPITDKERAEYIIRSSEGINGKINIKNARALSNMYKAYNTDTVKSSFDPSKSSSILFDNLTYTGSLIQPDLNDTSTYYTKVSELPEGTVDFVDAYINNETPMTNLGVVKKQQGKGEKRILRSAIKSYPNINVYQTHPDTLNTNIVNYLDSQLAKGLPENGDKTTTYNVSMYPEIFRIGDSNIIYDGNYTTVVGVKTPEGKYAYKSVDLFDFNPDNWNYRVSKKGKEVLKYLNENGNPYIMSSPWYYKPEWDWKVPALWSEGGKINKFDIGGPTEDYNAISYNGDIIVPIEEISITGNSGLTNYKPGTKDYINQIRKFTDRIYSGDLAIDAVPEYYRKGVQNTLRGDQFANKVKQSRDKNYKGLMIAMNSIPLLANPYSAHVAKVMMNPMSAMTEAGAATATLIDAAGAAYGLNQNIDLLGKAIKGNATWEDTVNFGLNTLGVLPYATALKRGMGTVGRIFKNKNQKPSLSTVTTLKEYNDLIDKGKPRNPANLKELIDSSTDDERRRLKSLVAGYDGEEFVSIPYMEALYFNNPNVSNSVADAMYHLRHTPQSTAFIESVVPDIEKVLKKQIEELGVSNRLGIRPQEGVITDLIDTKKYVSHGIKVSDFKHAVKDWDGMSIMPSMAILPVGTPNLFHHGELLFIGDKPLLNTSKIYNQDAWTPSVYNIRGSGLTPSEIFKRMKEMNSINTPDGRKISELTIGDVDNIKWQAHSIKPDIISSNPFFGMYNRYLRKKILPTKSPNEYLEAKYQEIIPFTDFKGVLIPESFKTDGVKWATDNNIPYRVYSGGRRSLEENLYPFIEELDVAFALGGPLYNQNNPIESFQGNPFIPVVRY